ncbi:LysR substrate-binding domain-containing protein [Kiloniella sp. b19]|uniref:LysR substrate-binding domain-containing protein n=1 Tax=Kiloniella sp. GXU_MW_B19 TaxID=3141326 RepID=UPI0031CECCE1
MRKLLRYLSSPRNLFIFEAAARTGSFTRAANELGIKQPSVSGGIKQLEEALGMQLFLREHRRVSLTAAGQKLFAATSRSLSEMEQAVMEISQAAEEQHVTISCSAAFSYYWLMPRLHHLRARYPHIDLRVLNTNREPDLQAENIGLGIRLGDGNWPGYESILLAREVIFPVASPEVCQAAGGPDSVEALVRQPLIHLEEPLRSRPGWAQWFGHHAVDYTEHAGSLRLNDYALVLQAALRGQGFACGWEHLVSEALEDRRLQGFRQWRWETGRGIYLIWHEKIPMVERTRVVRDWIVEIAGLSRGE